MHRSTEFAPALSEAQGVNAASLHANGLVDHLVDERDDAAEEAKAFCLRMGAAIEYELSSLAGESIDILLARRTTKYRDLGPRLAAPTG